MGVECLIVKPREEEETEQTIHAHPMPESVYSEDAVDKFIRSKNGDLAKKATSKNRLSDGLRVVAQTSRRPIYYYVHAKTIEGLFVYTHTTGVMQPKTELG